MRLQRARQLLVHSNAKIINVAYESGYRHLGLFNAMFKKRFGVTPSEWRQQNGPKNPPGPPRSGLSRPTAGMNLLLAMCAIFFSLNVFAQTTGSTNGDSPAVAVARAALYQKMAEQDAADKQAQAKAENERLRQKTEAEFGPVHHVSVSTNAGPRFKVERYLVTGNTILSLGIIGGIITNVPEAFGTNVTFEGIQAALGDLQMAYRERGYVTVSVGLPPQKLTNAVVKVRIYRMAPLAAPSTSPATAGSARRTCCALCRVCRRTCCSTRMCSSVNWTSPTPAATARFTPSSAPARSWVPAR